MMQISVKDKLLKALEKLQSEDRYLIENGVNERSISHKLAEYLQVEFPDYNVECEYSRDGSYPKKLELPIDQDRPDWDDTAARTVYPDVIVHKRGKQDENLLVIEIKKESNPMGANFDNQKLKAFVDQLCYRQTAFITFETKAPPEKGYELDFNNPGRR